MILYGASSLDFSGFYWNISFSPVCSSGGLVLVINIIQEYFAPIYVPSVDTQQISLASIMLSYMA